MSNRLEQRIAQFTEWRDRLVANVDEFRSWQDTYGQADIEQTLRIYDLVEGLRNDRIRLAFFGASTAHKTDLINALLFSDRPEGLLPREPGGDYCAMEIFHDPNEAPYVRVLPIDSRKRNESIAALRRNTIEWVTMRVDPDSPESIASTLKDLAETREASPDEVRALNLWNEGAGTRVPSWRYALVNLPHPTLKSGLTAFYTPGLAMLSAEPEIALRMAGSAQSLLMVLGDSLTAEAQTAWKQYVQNARGHKFVVLSGNGAESAQALASPLGLDVQHIYADSAEANTQALEERHAEEIVPERQALLLSAVAKEIGPLVLAARQTVASRFISTVKEMQDLSSTAGKNRDEAQDMLVRLETERKEYQRSVSAFNVTYADLMARGQELLATLHDERIEELLSHDREFIEDAWTTAGLWKNMQGLFSYFTVQVEKILNYAVKLREAVGGIYDTFHANFGLAKLNPPPLTLEKYLEAMKALEENARQFCHDPVNIATYKSNLVEKFYEGLVEEARQQFELTRLDTERWLRGALGPLNAQIMEKQRLMLKRVESLRNLKDNQTSVQERFRALDQQRASLKKATEVLDQLRTNLELNPASGGGTPAAAAPTATAS